MNPLLVFLTWCSYINGNTDDKYHALYHRNSKWQNPDQNKAIQKHIL